MAEEKEVTRIEIWAVRWLGNMSEFAKLNIISLAADR
jgi:hypothetical protein